MAKKENTMGAVCFWKNQRQRYLNALAHAIGSAVPNIFGPLNVEVIINSFQINDARGVNCNRFNIPFCILF